MYKGSPYRLLSAMYPDYEWLPWKFEKVPENFWNKFENIKWFMEWVGKQLGIKELNDWNKVTQKQVEILGGVTLLDKKNLYQILSQVFPEHNFTQRSSFNKKSQHVLKSMLKVMFPQEGILLRCHGNQDSTGRF